MKKLLLTFFIIFSTYILSAQKVYKTPSGQKYHTAVCKFVKNVSEELSISQAQKKGLTACKVCNPNSSEISKFTNESGLGIKSNEAKGVAPQTTQCKGKTQKGNRCKRMTKNKNGYCFQHES